MSQTFKVTASPRQRLALARLLFSPSIKLKKRAEDKSLYRLRRALGLLELSQVYQHYNQTPGPERVGEIANDSSTRHVFELTHDNVDFLFEQLEKIEKRPGDVLWLDELLEQIEEKKDAADAAEYPPLDAAAEAPLWRPPLNVLLENPTLTVQVLRELITGAESYGAFRKAFLEASKPPDADPET